MLPKAVTDILATMPKNVTQAQLQEYNQFLSRLFPWALAKAKAGIHDGWLLYEIDLTKLSTKKVRESAMLQPKDELNYVLAQHVTQDMVAIRSLAEPALRNFSAFNIKTPAELFKYHFDQLNEELKEENFSVILADGKIFFIPRAVFFANAQDSGKNQAHFRASINIFFELMIASVEMLGTSNIVDSAVMHYANNIKGYYGLLDPAAILADSQAMGATSVKTVRKSLYDQKDYYPPIPTNSSDQRAAYFDLRATALGMVVLIKVADYDALMTVYHHDIKTITKNSIINTNLANTAHLKTLETALASRQAALVSALKNKSICIVEAKAQKDSATHLIEACTTQQAQVADYVKQSKCDSLTLAQKESVSDWLKEMEALLDVNALSKEIETIVMKATTLKKEVAAIQSKLKGLDDQRNFMAQFEKPERSERAMIISKEPEILSLIDQSNRIHEELNQLKDQIGVINLKLKNASDKARDVKIRMTNKLLSAQRELGRETLRATWVPAANQVMDLNPAPQVTFFNGTLAADGMGMVENNDAYYIYNAAGLLTQLAGDHMQSFVDKRKVFVGETGQGLKFLDARPKVLCAVNGQAPKEYNLLYEFKFSNDAQRVFYIDVVSENQPDKHLLVPLIYSHNGLHTTAEKEKLDTEKVYALQVGAEGVSLAKEAVVSLKK